MPSIFLISSNTNVEPYPIYPIGMSVIAKALQDAGHKVIQYDMLASGNNLDHLKRSIISANPDYTGISIRNVDNVDSFTSHTNQYIHKVRQIVKIVKGLRIKVIAGGAGFSLLPEEILEYIGADYGIVGEGELKMVRLISHLENGDEVPAIFKPEEGIKGENIPLPLWSEELLKFYIAKSGVINVQTKRGCENHCSYCTYPFLEGHRMRVRPPENIADEIEILRAQGADNFFFTDSVFNDRNGHYLQVAEEIVRRKLSIKWCAFFQPHKIENSELKLLKQSGLKAMEVGTDATTDTTMKALHKGFTFNDVMDFNEKCVASKNTMCSFRNFRWTG